MRHITAITLPDHAMPRIPVLPVKVLLHLAGNVAEDGVLAERVLGGGDGVLLLCFWHV